MENLNFDSIKTFLTVLQNIMQELVKLLKEVLNIKYGDDATKAE